MLDGVHVSNGCGDTTVVRVGFGRKWEVVMMQGGLLEVKIVMVGETGMKNDQVLVQWWLG